MRPSTPGITRLIRPHYASPAARFWQLMLVLLLCGVTFLALSPVPPPSVAQYWDKLNHAGAFAALTMSGLLGLCPHRSGSWRVLIPLLAFGGLIELLQLLVPGRSCDLEDLTADALGMAVGALLAFMVTRISQWWRRRPRPAVA